MCLIYSHAVECDLMTVVLLDRRTTFATYLETCRSGYLDSYPGKVVVTSETMHT